MYQRTDLKTLMTLYEKVVLELVYEIHELPDESLALPLVGMPGVENYKNIQKLLTKLVCSCYQSSGVMYKMKGESFSAPEPRYHTRIKDYVTDMRDALQLTKRLFSESQEESVEKFAAILKMDTCWSHIYQQAIEHAIVQVLRHKMLIESIRISEFDDKLSSYVGN
jgi:hypothetical protein